MTVVAVIPARGGSKGLPRKNLQPIEGIPLVGRAVRTALAAKSIDRVFVSTEDNEIARVAKDYGAEVIRRPAELATDEAASTPVMQHALACISDADRLVRLECTHPLTTAADIDGAVRLHQTPGIDVVASVCRDYTHSVRPIPTGVVWVAFERNGEDSRRQDLQATYRLAGGIVVYWIEGLRAATSSFYGHVALHEIPEDRAVDIDTPVDLHIARSLADYHADQWIVAGASPSAREGLAAARASYPAATTITTNGGQGLFEGDERPDHYLIYDSIACTKHQEHARAFAARGTRTITLFRPSHQALVSRGVDWFDEFLVLNGQDHPGQFSHGKYASCGLSGLMCLQYALNQRARGVHLVGLEGYGDSGHYFDGHADLTPEKNSRFTKELIEPFVQSCIDACPDVQFHFYGNLNYDVSGSNVWRK